MTSSLHWSRRARIGALALAASLAVTPARSQALPEGGHWVGTWAAAPQAAFPGAVDRYAGRTLRLVVHVSVGGERVRIRLSNTHGRVPLHIAHVHVARRGQGADIDPATDRALRFGGHPGVVIAPGRTVTSDAVALAVPALSDLAVSLYAPGRIDATSVHALAQQTSYVATAPGDATAAAHFPEARPLSAWPFLTGVDVDVPGGGGAIVVFGDSLVDGDGSTPDANARVGDALAARLQQAGGACARVAVLDTGIIGNRLLHDSPQRHAAGAPDFGRALGEAGLARFERDALQLPGVRAVLVHLGSNDIGFEGGVAPPGETASADALMAGLRELVARAHRAGLTAIGSTLTPVEGVTLLPGYDTPAKEAARLRVNDWIRHGGAFDRVLDFDLAVRDPGHPARLAPSLASPDHLHPNDAGYAAIAERLPLDSCQAFLAP